ncbi:hypothetical protein FKM82_016490 [Ascaphus truei]
MKKMMTVISCISPLPPALPYNHHCATLWLCGRQKCLLLCYLQQSPYSTLSLVWFHAAQTGLRCACVSRLFEACGRSQWSVQ